MSESRPIAVVTGGAGFIGSAFIRLALEWNSECKVVNFDALTYAGNVDNLAGLDGRRHRFVCGDITDREAVLANLGTATDAIINFAAESHVDRSIFSADEFLKTKREVVEKSGHVEPGAFGTVRFEVLAARQVHFFCAPRLPLPKCSRATAAWINPW